MKCQEIYIEKCEKSNFEKLLLLHLSTTTPSIRHSHYLLQLASWPTQLVQACTPSLPRPTSKSKSSLVKQSKEKKKTPLPQSLNSTP
jgi:hypothetical protein